MDRLLRVLLSLNPVKDQTLGETAVDIGLGFVPGVGTAQALRDFERARREGDKLGMGLSALQAIPVVGGIPKTVSKVFKSAKRANPDELAKLTIATSAEKAGAPLEDIWKKTGWMKTADDRWVTEVPDTQFVLKDFGDISHPELAKYYPDLSKELHWVSAELPQNVLGEYDHLHKILRINDQIPQSNQKRVAVHELQHYIDDVDKVLKNTSREPGQPMYELADQYRSALKTRNTAMEAQKAAPLIRRGTSIDELAEHIATNSDQVLDYTLLDSLLRKQSQIPSVLHQANKTIKILEDANVKPNAWENYLYNPSEAIARLAEYRSTLAPHLLPFESPYKNMAKDMLFPVELSKQLRLYKPL